MPATVIAERVGWQHSMTILKERVRELRPLFVGVDPTDRVVYEPGQVAQCDLWFPPLLIPVGGGQAQILPVLAMTCGYSRITGGAMIPSRQGGDILAGMWAILGAWGASPRTLVWDREAAIGGTGKLTVPAATFAGTLGVRIKLAPPAPLRKLRKTEIKVDTLTDISEYQPNKEIIQRAPSLALYR